MKFRLTAIAAALSVLVIGPVYADGTGGCNYSKYRYTSAEPQEPTAAEDKLASLDAPAGKTAAEPDKTAATQPAQPTSAQ